MDPKVEIPGVFLATLKTRIYVLSCLATNNLVARELSERRIYKFVYICIYI